MNAARPDDSGDGFSWATASKTIQAAINASTAGDTITVTNGVYAPITTTNNSITIQSVNGANVTIIDGGGTNSCTILGSSESDTNTILVGFTLRNGSFYYGGGSCYGTLNNCTLTGNSASFDGGGSYYGTLNNCTLTGNSAYSGGGTYCGTLNNCTLTGNSASDRGGGSYYGTLNNCTLTGNSASSEGGGSYDCILYNCMLKGNNAYSGGGANCGTLNNCTLTGNSASYGGGGAWEGTLNNCTLTGNSASELGGGSCYGTLNNCTLTGNRASSGGGSCGCTLINCIVWGNTHISGVTNNYSWGTFSYSCTAPLPSGPGNVSADPFFRLPAAGDFRLSHGSPCLNAGTNGYVVGAVDVFGNARIQDGTVDMGACEGAWSLMTDGQHLVQNISAIGGAEGISVSWGPPSDVGAILYRVCRMEMLTGQWTPISGWISGGSFLDTQVFGGVACRYAIVTAFDTQLDVISGLSTTAEGQRYLVPLYVDAVRPDDAGDGRSWLTAKKTIQAAISTSAPYDTIFVTNGVYSPFLTSNKLLAIQSVNGASVTIIDGGGTNRCATLGNTLIHLSTFLNGFTLRNGYASEGAGSCYGTLNNCTLTGNIAADAGGGSHGGALNNCTLTGNSAFYGGGSYYGTLNSCTLTGNSATTYGGGASRGTLNNCTLTGNSVPGYGGGAYSCTLNECTLTGNSSFFGGGACDSTLNNSTLTGNSASTYGGGSCGGTLDNCTLTGNIASTSGGGAYGDMLNNCTLTGNSATYSGGGVSHGTLNNCIVWGNMLASGETNNYLVGTFRYSCTMPLPSGTGNISSYPLFQDEVNSNFMLRAESPCINAGSNAFAVGTMDLGGNARIQDGTVDMGAYEMPTVTVTFDANRGVLATGQSITNRVGFAGDCYDSWLTLSNGIARVGYMFAGWFSAATGGMPVLSNHTITPGRVYAQWIPARPIIPGNPNVSSNFLDTVTQAHIDALVAGLRAAHPDVTDAEIAKKFEDADLFGFTGVALVGVGTDALVRLNPSITLSTLSVVEGDPKTLVVTVAIGNNIEPTPAAALARIGEMINSRMRGVFKSTLSAGASETILTPMLSLDNATGVITATFTLENPFALSGFLRMSLRK